MDGDLFKVSVKSVRELLGEHGKGFYVPSYQRDYRWKTSDCERLLGSLCEGLHNLQEMGDSLAYLGTFIFVNDVDHRTVEPHVQGELPGSVFLVIDGQQRMSTLLLLAVDLLERVRAGRTKIKDAVEADNDIASWIDRQLAAVEEPLRSLLYFDKGYGRAPAKFYPRLIRAHLDSWSSSERTQCYESPIAHFLYSHAKHLHGSADGLPGAPFRWNPPIADESSYIEKNLSAIRKRLGELTDGAGDERNERLPQLIDCVCEGPNSPPSPRLAARFFTAGLPPDNLVELFANESLTRKRGAGPVSDRDILRLARLAMLASFFLDKVAIAEVRVSREDFAFDLFESINTTGVPLTAYETFRPLFIKDETLEFFKGSPSAGEDNRVLRFLRAWDDKKVVAANNRLIIPFALSETGDRLGKALRDQRNWLRKAYENDGGDADRAEDRLRRRRWFLRGLGVTSQFLTECWLDKPDAEPHGVGARIDGLAPGADHSEIAFLLNVLRSANHEVCVALLSRYYGAVLDSEDEGESMRALKAFVEVARSAVAFWALWRGYHGSTDNIDSHHRTLMSKGLVDENGNEVISAVARRPRGRSKADAEKTELPAAAKVRTYFRTILANAGASDAQAFAARAANIPIHSASTQVARFLLLAAAHNRDADPHAVGMLRRTKPGVARTMNLETWAEQLTVEHVAPQASTSAWDRDIYDRNLVHTLGNLWLLPDSINASASNRPWREKHFLYRALAARTPAEMNEIVADAQNLDVKLPAFGESRLAAFGYQASVESLAAYPVDFDWNADAVLERGRHLADCAWATLSAWLRD